MLKIAICDDDSLFLDMISEKIRQELNVRNIEFETYLFSVSSELTQAVRSGKLCPDIAFLDIEMAPPDGKLTAAKIKNASPKCQIVFITSHDEEMENSFDFNAFGFIPKFRFTDKISSTIERLLKNIVMSKPHLCVFEIKNSRNETETLALPVTDILFFESILRSVYVTTIRNECYMLKNCSLKELKEKYSEPPFAVPHESYIVNMQHIQKIGKSDILIGPNSKIISLSKHRKSCFIQQYSTFVTSF